MGWCVVLHPVCHDISIKLYLPCLVCGTENSAKIYLWGSISSLCKCQVNHSDCCLVHLLGETKAPFSICPCAQELKGLKFPGSVQGFLCTVTKEVFDGLLLPPLSIPFSPVPFKISPC